MSDYPTMNGTKLKSAPNEVHPMYNGQKVVDQAHFNSPYGFHESSANSTPLIMNNENYYNSNAHYITTHHYANNNELAVPTHPTNNNNYYANSMQMQTDFTQHHPQMAYAPADSLLVPNDFSDISSKQMYCTPVSARYFGHENQNTDNPCLR